MLRTEFQVPRTASVRPNALLILICSSQNELFMTFLASRSIRSLDIKFNKGSLFIGWCWLVCSFRVFSCLEIGRWTNRSHFLRKVIFKKSTNLTRSMNLIWKLVLFYRSGMIKFPFFCSFFLKDRVHDRFQQLSATNQVKSWKKNGKNANLVYWTTKPLW